MGITVLLLFMVLPVNTKGDWEIPWDITLEGEGNDPAFRSSTVMEIFLKNGTAPKEVIRLLNERKNQIYAVRGNCEAEVDQMVLDFPVMADYCILAIEGKTMYATHGHIYNKDNLPPMMDGDILIHGHTHVLKAENMGNYILLNPGSVSIPKEGNPPTYAILENGIFTIKDFEGNTVREITL